jgi:uncharacterized protein YaaQ
MKMIISILRDMDSDPVSHALTSASYRVTVIASTGGFLRRGNTTLLIGTEDEKVEAALDLIRKNCAPASEPGQKRATIFVLKVDQYTHF